MVQTAPSSPMYKHHNRGLNLESEQTENGQTQGRGGQNSQDIVSFFSEKLAQMKDQMNLVLMQNSKKIKELESLLLQNKQQIEAKNH